MPAAYLPIYYCTTCRYTHELFPHCVLLCRLMSQLGAKLGMAPITNTAATTAASTASSADSTGMPESLPVCCLLPLHGPVVSSAVQELVTGYVRWTGEQVAAAATSCVAVLYASAYGNTASLAQAISRGITKVRWKCGFLRSQGRGGGHCYRANRICQ